MERKEKERMDKRKDGRGRMEGAEWKNTPKYISMIKILSAYPDNFASLSGAQLSTSDPRNVIHTPIQVQEAASAATSQSRQARRDCNCEGKKAATFRKNWNN